MRRLAVDQILGDERVHFVIDEAEDLAEEARRKARGLSNHLHAA